MLIYIFTYILILILFFLSNLKLLKGQFSTINSGQNKKFKLEKINTINTIEIIVEKKYDTFIRLNLIESYYIRIGFFLNLKEISFSKL